MSLFQIINLSGEEISDALICSSLTISYISLSEKIIFMSCVARNLHDMFLELVHLCEIDTSNDVLKCVKYASRERHNQSSLIREGWYTFIVKIFWYKLIPVKNIFLYSYTLLKCVFLKHSMQESGDQIYPSSWWY